jgi:uncharacterized protein YbaR (Trm112 family)
MHEHLLNLLRCPFCGVRLTLDENAALARTDTRIDTGVLACECCAYPIIAGIPILKADDTTTRAMHALEAGRADEALFLALDLDAARGSAFRRLLADETRLTYRNAVALLSVDAEGAYFVYRFSDPTFVAAEALLQAVGPDSAVTGPVLDLCGGSGHLTRVITGLGIEGGTVLADDCFWKLWLASTFTAPGSAPICCDANLPLPFARGAFPTVVLSDAFHYIWHKRLLADEIQRLTGPDGVVVLPHLHSALGENHSAGMPLTPAAYLDLFAPLAPRLFGDDALLSQAVSGSGIDLGRHLSQTDLDHQASLTLVASRRNTLFRAYPPSETAAVSGVLAVNPLYHLARRDSTSELTLAFPTAEYEAEFGDCRRYLPTSVTMETDLSGVIDPAAVGTHYGELRRRRVLLDLPAHY